MFPHGVSGLLLPIVARFQPAKEIKLSQNFDTVLRLPSETALTVRDAKGKTESFSEQKLRLLGKKCKDSKNERSY